MDAVGVGQFAVVVAFDDIHVVALLVPLRVRLLDAASAGGVVAGHGEAYHRPVGEHEGFLHEPLAERAATHDEPAVLVLDGPGDDFGGRGGIFVHEDDDAPFAETSRTLGAVLTIRGTQSLGIDDEVAFGQELPGDVRGGIQVSASVLLQVEDEVLHALPAQFVDGIRHLLVAGTAEAGQADQSDAGGGHVGGIHGGDGNLVALHGEVQPGGLSAAHDAEAHFRAFRPAQAAHDFLAAHFHARNGRVVHADDAVARKDSGFLGRSFRHGLDDDKRVLKHVELHTDAVEVALKRFVHLLGLFGVGVGRVGVESGEHAVDGVLGELVFVHAVHVEAADGQLGHGELAQ